VKKIATTTGSAINNKYKSYPTVKTVNGKEVGDDCVCCGKHVEMGAWLCGVCAHIIGHQAINDIVNNMPEYLGYDQYEKWLKLKLGKIRYGKD
jgi:hypothetical protein